MKKAYVKVKPKSVKKTLARPYIVVTVLSAAICAFVFSVLFKPAEVEPEPMQIDVSQVTPEEIAQVSETVEIEVSKVPEIKNPEPARVEELPKTEEVKKEETEEAEEKEPGFNLPVQGEIMNDYSGSKPVKSKTTGDWRVHSGIDIKAQTGIEVKSPADGEVIVAGDNSLTGKTVTIRHADGYETTMYNLGSISVKPGEKVKSGDVIGTVGISAPVEAAEEAHVHFEMKKDGKYVDPQDYAK